MATEFPKWVQRAPHIGAVLCLTAAEETKLLDDFADEVSAAAAAEKKAVAAEKALRESEVLAAADAIKQAQAAELALSKAAEAGGKK